MTESRADNSAQVMADADSASSEELEAVAEILDRLIKPSERLRRLESFWRELVRYFGWGGSFELDGGDFQDMAEKHGLIRFEDYDPEKHTDEWIEAEPGDPIWFDNLATGKEYSHE